MAPRFREALIARRVPPRTSDERTLERKPGFEALQRELTEAFSQVTGLAQEALAPLKFAAE